MLLLLEVVQKTNKGDFERKKNRKQPFECAAESV